MKHIQYGKGFKASVDRSVIVGLFIHESRAVCDLYKVYPRHTAFHSYMYVVTNALDVMSAAKNHWTLSFPYATPFSKRPYLYVMNSTSSCKLYATELHINRD